MAVVAGVYTGKASLEVSISEGPVLWFDNRMKGISKLVKHLPKQEATLAVCESTGGYERLLVSRLHRAEGYEWPTPAGGLSPRPASTKPRPTHGTFKCFPNPMRR